MSTYYASLNIGGDVPAKLIRDLGTLIDQERTDDAYSDEMFWGRCLDLSEMYSGRGHLHINSAQATNGEFHDLEAFLRENKLSFDRFADEETLYVREFAEYAQVCDDDGYPVYSEYDRAPVLKELRMGMAAKARKLLEDLLTVPVLPPFRIVP